MRCCMHLRVDDNVDKCFSISLPHTRTHTHTHTQNTHTQTRCEQLEEDMCGWVPALTWQSRLFGCLFCFLIGTILQFGSFFRFAKLLAGNPEPFALMYTLGNIVSIG